MNALRRALLDWYDASARDLPWRVGPAARRRGERADPYRVWLSEVMLQQTTVPHATPYFLAFLQRWPGVADLAGADDAEVMGAWAGLGYYARARNMLACARAVAARGGVFPDDEEGLRALPGVGAYTAAAVAAIAFDRPATVVDGNVERVVSRLFAVETPLPGAKGELKTRAAEIADPRRPGDWAQATMDLGAMICRPREPLCDRCPLAGVCAARALGTAASFPRKAARKARPHRHGAVYVAVRDGEVALVRRPPRGLLGGMLSLPGGDWTAERPEPGAGAPTRADWRAAGEVEHVFTHFSLTLQVWRAEVSGEIDGAQWTPLAGAGEGLPSVFLKALRAAL